MEATSQLFSFFSKADYFEMKEHFKDVVLISENKDLEVATVEAGLESLVEMGVVVKKQSADKGYWILNKPLVYYEQKVELKPNTALAVAALVNDVCSKMENTDDMCDATSITDADIGNLVIICENLFKRVEESQKDD